MTKPNPAVRYFVGKFKEAKRGSYHHVVRRTTKKGIFGKKMVEHVYDRAPGRRLRLNTGRSATCFRPARWLGKRSARQMAGDCYAYQ